MPRALILALAGALVSLPAAATAAAEGDYKVAPLKEAPPEAVAAAIREVVAAEGLRVTDKEGKPFVDLWPRKSVETIKVKAELGVKFGEVPEGTLLGVLRFHKKSGDFKGNDFPDGVYTARRGLQPIDGDHQGVSETRDFLLLAPAKVDQKPDAMSTKEAIKLSVQSAGIKHPSVLWLRKASPEGAKLPRLVEEQGGMQWSLEYEVATQAKQPLQLGVVLVGKAEEH